MTKMTILVEISPSIALFEASFFKGRFSLCFPMFFAAILFRNRHLLCQHTTTNDYKRLENVCKRSQTFANGDKRLQTFVVVC